MPSLVPDVQKFIAVYFVSAVREIRSLLNAKLTQVDDETCVQVCDALQLGCRFNAQQPHSVLAALG
jgi:hypothetical protein